MKFYSHTTSVCTKKLHFKIHSDTTLLSWAQLGHAFWTWEWKFPSRRSFVYENFL